MKDKNHKPVLVTGGAGFIGPHLCERLLREGCDVLCVENYYTASKENILHLLENPYFEIIRQDITFPLYVEVDEIYNPACPASPVHYQNDPGQITKVNVHGSINILGLAKRLKAKILQASSSEVYGDPAVRPQPETYLGSVNPIGPCACYHEGKRCAETLFFDYHRQHEVKIGVIVLEPQREGPIEFLHGEALFEAPEEAFADGPKKPFQAQEDFPTGHVFEVSVRLVPLPLTA